jgi:hypothetical protein
LAAIEGHGLLLAGAETDSAFLPSRIGGDNAINDRFDHALHIREVSITRFLIGELLHESVRVIEVPAHDHTRRAGTVRM